MSTETSDQYAVWRDGYLGIQGLFYFAQGVAMGALFFLTAFLDYLTLSPFERIVVQAIIWIPWYVKIIFGILSDNFPIKSYGRRKPYIFLAGILGIIGWITLPMHTVYSSILLVSGILASLGTSMSDATIDALAVDITPPEKRGAMQGVSWGSRGLGVGVSAVAVGILADQNAWFIIFAVPGVLVGIAALLVLLFKEKPLPIDFKRVKLSIYGSVFRKRNVQVCIIFQLLSGAAIAILSIMQTFLDENLGFDNTTIGIVFAVFSIGMFAGALTFGLLGDKISIKYTLPVTTIAYVVLVMSVLVIDISVVTVSMVFFLGVGIANGGYEATQMRISMDNSPAIAAGTMYNLYNSLSNVGQIALGAIVIAAFVEYFGSFALGWQIAWVFLIVALIPGYLLATKYQSEVEGVSEEIMVTPE